MPGTTPVLEAIRQDLLATIGRITVAGGYTFDAVAIDPDRLGDPTGDGVVVVQLGGAADWNREVSGLGVIEWLQEFQFIGYVVQNETNIAPWDGQMIQRYADIYRALQVDYTRGGNAHDTNPDAPEWFKRTAGQHEGVGVRCFVRYRHSWGDPYTVR